MKSKNPPALHKAALKPSGRRYSSVEEMLKEVMPAKSARELLANMAKHRSVKAQKMWVNPIDLEDKNDNLILTRKQDTREHRVTITRVAVLDISDPEALVEQVAIRMSREESFSQSWLGIGNASQEWFRQKARAVLQSLGILPPVKGRK